MSCRACTRWCGSGWTSRRGANVTRRRASGVVLRAKARRPSDGHDHARRLMRQVILDTETTGLEVRDGHRIIEIGCLELVGRRLTERSFHVYLNPERASDEGALAVHGLRDEFLADKPK